MINLNDVDFNSKFFMFVNMYKDKYKSYPIDVKVFVIKETKTRYADTIMEIKVIFNADGEYYEMSAKRTEVDENKIIEEVAHYKNTFCSIVSYDKYALSHVVKEIKARVTKFFDIYHKVPFLNQIMLIDGVKQESGKNIPYVAIVERKENIPMDTIYSAEFLRTKEDNILDYVNIVEYVYDVLVNHEVFGWKLKESCRWDMK